MKSFLQYITEAPISSSDLIKHSKKNPSNLRMQDLYNKVKRGDPFDTTPKSEFNGGPIEIDFISKEVEFAFRDGNENKLEKGGKYFTLKSDPTRIISLSTLQKTEEFGSSRGSGGGAESTEVTEVLQSLFFVYVFNTGKKATTELTPDEMKEYWSYMRTSTGWPKIEGNAVWGDSDWMHTFAVSANDYYAFYKSKYGTPNKPIIVHRDSKFMNEIYNKFKNLRKQAGTSMNLDKWNPGDVWMATTKGHDLTTQQFTTLQQYNDYIANLYNSGDLVGISLKKLGSGATPKIKEFNVSPSKDIEIDIRLASVNGERGGTSFFSNKKLIVSLSNGAVIDFRAFNRDQSFQGEIKGKAAAAGKISHGPINEILKRNGIDQMPSQKKITSIARRPNDKFYEDFYRLFQRHNTDSKERGMSYDQFVGAIESMDPDEANNFRFSKYLSVVLLDILQSNKNKLDKVIPAILGYASSQTDLSSVYVKIS